MFTSSLDFEALKSMVSGKDPVCGMEVEASKAAGMSDYGGKTFYFCAPACKKAFDEDPGKYAGKE
jgi:YHS domain-containing protein